MVSSLLVSDTRNDSWSVRAKSATGAAFEVAYACDATPRSRRALLTPNAKKQIQALGLTHIVLTAKSLMLRKDYPYYLAEPAVASGAIKLGTELLIAAQHLGDDVRAPAEGPFRTNAKNSYSVKEDRREIIRFEQRRKARRRRRRASRWWIYLLSLVAWPLALYHWSKRENVAFAWRAGLPKNGKRRLDRRRLP